MPVRILFFSAAFLISASVFAAPCSIYRVKALAKKSDKGIFLILYPMSRSESTIKVSESSMLKVFPFLNKTAKYSVKMKAPFENFSVNEGEVLTAEMGITEPHLSGLGTSISCIE